MRLTVLRLRNWLCHRDREVQLAPLTLIRGPNGSGKSSIRDAIDFVLTGAVQRVPLKGMRPMLLSEGTKEGDQRGSVELVAGGLLYRRDIRTGKLIGACTIEPDCARALPFVLVPEAFAATSPAARRDLLMDVLHVARDAATMKAALISTGQHPATMVAELPEAAPELWPDVVERWRSEARGAWQEVTGERWGAAAATWRVARPAHVPTDDEFRQITDAILEHRNERRKLGSALALIQADAVRIELARERLAHLAPMVAKHDEIRVARADAAVELARIQHEQAQEALLRLTTGYVVCLECGTLTPREAAPGQVDMLAVGAARLEAMQKAVVLTAARSAAQADLQLHHVTSASVREHDALIEKLAGYRDGADQVAKVEAAIRDHEMAIIDLETEAIAMNARVRADRHADHRERLATAKQETVDALTALLSAIRASGMHTLGGLPTALATFNATLAGHGRDLGWPAPSIDTDCAITVAGRPYVLLSEAQRWRADAILAVALAQASGARLVALDRWDVLEPRDRMAPLHWLADLTASGEMDTAILAGTVAAPRCPPPGDIAWVVLP